MLVICWDYDGTLVSSELIYKNIFVNYLKKIGAVVKNIDDDYYFKKYAGKHPFNVIKQLKIDGYIDKNVEIDVDELNDIFQNELKNSNSLLLTNGIEKVLDTISCSNDTAMAIVTSTYRIDFNAKHDNPSVAPLKKYFDANKNVYICGEVGNKELKPDPNGYIFAYNDLKEKYNLTPDSNIVMVEDSVSGCKSAYNAKMELHDKINVSVIGYLAANKYVRSEDLIEAGADYIANNSDELLKILTNISKA